MQTAVSKVIEEHGGWPGAFLTETEEGKGKQ